MTFHVFSQLKLGNLSKINLNYLNNFNIYNFIQFLRAITERIKRKYEHKKAQKFSIFLFFKEKDDTEKL